MVVLIGEALVDLIDGKAYAGGCQFNASLSARRLGVPVTLLDHISTDAYGVQIAGRLEKEGIVVPEAFLHDPRPTMYSKVVLDAKGQATYVFKTEGTATLGYDAKELEAALDGLKGVEAILIGSVAIMLPPVSLAITKAVKAYKKKHPEVTIFLDPNVRPSLIHDQNAYRSWMKDVIRMADMIKMSDEDLAYLMGTGSYEGDLKALHELNPCELVITRGSKGSEWHRGEKVFKAPAGKIKIVDTVGAGDTFNGALLRSLHVLGKKASAYTDEECEEALSIAARAADINCTRRGCDPPTAKELGL
jgi:fructokinase